MHREKHQKTLVTLTLKFDRVLKIVEEHVRAKFHQAKWSGSVIGYTNVFALSHNGKESENPVGDLDLWPWNSMGFEQLSRYVFRQNVIKLRAAVLLLFALSPFLQCII